MALYSKPSRAGFNRRKQIKGVQRAAEAREMQKISRYLAQAFGATMALQRQSHGPKGRQELMKLRTMIQAVLSQANEAGLAVGSGR